MLNKVFIYDEILKQSILDILNITPTQEQLAEVTAKMYNINRTQYLFDLHDITHNRNNRSVLGAIYTFDEKHMEKVLNALDSYKGCSESRIGFANPNDLCIRSTILAYPIVYNTIREIETFTYKYNKPVKCLAYKGNAQHPNLIKAIKIDRHQKVANGVYKQGIIDVVKRLEQNKQTKGEQ